MQYSFDCFALDSSSTDDALKVVTLAWGHIEGTILYLFSNHKKGSYNQISNLGWIVIVMGEYLLYCLPSNICFWFWEKNLMSCGFVNHVSSAETGL